MARSRRGRRAARRNAGEMVPGSIGDVSRGMDWVIAGGVVPAGGGTAAAGVSWGAAPITLVAGTSCAYQAFSLPKAAMAPNSPPAIGEVEILQIQGSIFFDTPLATAVYQLGVGISIEKQANAVGVIWPNPRYPSLPADGAADDWLYLRTKRMNMVLQAAQTVPGMVEFVLSLPRPLRLGGGEALSVHCDNQGPNSVNVSAYFRTAYRTPR